MRFRKLRIAWSAGCGVACVLLVVLWVRSYKNGGSWEWLFLDKERVAVRSQFGSLNFDWRTENNLPEKRRLATDQLDSEVAVQMQDLLDSHIVAFSTTQFSFACPYWLTIVIAGCLAVAAWLPWRFSLRTLLIATTLVAVVLGLLVWWRRGN
jgi:hypothetical protein